MMMHKRSGKGGRGAVRFGGVRMYVNEKLSLCENAKISQGIWGPGRGLVWQGSGWMCTKK